MDDEADIRLLVRLALRHDGIEVLPADGGMEALALLEAGEVPDLVLLDLQMPEMDGWETLTSIRARRPDLPVVLCTVKSSFRDQERAWQLGCDGYVRKPFDINALADVVRRVAAMSIQERLTARAEALEEIRRAAAS